MKKFILALFMALGTSAFAENVLQIMPATYEAGKTVYFNVELVNDCPIDGVSFDLYLPEGFSMGSVCAIYPGYNDEASDYQAPTNGSRNAYYDEEGEVYLTAQSLSKNAMTLAPTEYEGAGACTRIMTVSMDGYPFSGNSGQIIRFQVKIPAGAEGYYPVTLRNIQLSSSEANLKDKVLCSTSYIKVGNPTNATLALEGKIASFVNESLAKETGISTLDLSKVTASNGTFTYVDGRAVKAPEAAVKGKVAYKREVSGLASVCLPFAADIKAYTYTEMAGEYAIFDEVSNLAANTPAIVDANIDITVEEATISSVEGKTINSGYYLKGGNLCKVNGSAKIAPLRGCWDITAPVKGFKFNDADAILTVDANANEDIFNLNGVKLNKAQRGVNIIGGKKVMK